MYVIFDVETDQNYSVFTELHSFLIDNRNTMLALMTISRCVCTCVYVFKYALVVRVCNTQVKIKREIKMKTLYFFFF